MNRVQAGFFSLSQPPDPVRDTDYLRWHALDHMPEQYRLPGIVHAARWMADDGCVAARIAGTGPLADVGGAVNYLFGAPVQETHDDFMRLGTRLAELGRFPIRRASLELDFLALLSWYAAPKALVSAEVVPFRPHRGIVLLVEEPATEDPADWLLWLHRQHHQDLLQAPGVAGVWMYGSTSTWQSDPIVQSAPRWVTVVYLDEDPVTTSDALGPMLEHRWSSSQARVLFAGPLRSTVSHSAWPDSPGNEAP